MCKEFIAALASVGLEKKYPFRLVDGKNISAATSLPFHHSSSLIFWQ